MSSYDEIKLDYDLAEEMARTFQQGVEQLQDTMQEMQNLANTLEEGALVGRAGTAFVDGLRNNLCPALGRFTDKFQELKGDVEAAIQAMREADKQSSGLFR